MRSLSLILGAILLTACDHPQGFCPAPVHPSPVAREWLKTLTPPPSVKEYFDRIGDQQEAIEAICR